MEAFKGSQSEKELAAAFRAGAHMGADYEPNMRLLYKQYTAVLRSKRRNAIQVSRLTGVEIPENYAKEPSYEEFMAMFSGGDASGFSIVED